MNLLKPEPGYKVSPTLVAANILVFIAFSIANLSFTQFSPASMYWFGANFSNWVEQGQWWRFVSSLFLHFGPMHLIFNCVSILFLGRIIEPLLGYFNFGGLYFVTGIIASSASFTFNKDVFSAGASGAIFGLFGVFIAILLSNIIRKDLRDEWLKSVGTILVINLGMGFILPVDNAAHIGGLLSGLVLGFAFIPAIRRRLRRLLEQQPRPPF